MEINQETNILLIDEDTSVGNMLKRISAQERYGLCISSSGEEGHSLFFKKSFNIVIIDLNCCEDSLELLNRFKEKDSLVCLIVTSASASLNTVIEAMRQGAYDYLTKPFSEDQIKQVLRRAKSYQKEEIEKQRLSDDAGQKEYYHQLSIVDALTGVYNYRYFNDMFNHEVARAKRYPQEFSLLMIDVDGFKNYNDSKGHPQGDKLLREIAQFFVGAIRTVDMVFRYGGEEFTILLPQTPKEGAIAASRRILNSFRKKLPVTISMGIATFPEDAESKEGLIEKADHALYQAKFLGKDRVCVFGRTDAIND